MPPSQAPARDIWAGEPDTVVGERRSTLQRVSRVLIVAMLAGVVVMWIYAFFGDKTSPARLDDRTFPTAAEPVCARARDEIDQLPRAFETPEPAHRADVVDRATTTLDGMVAELRGLVPPDPSTRDRLGSWLGDWDIYLQDRRDYTARLRVDREARYYSSQSERDRSQINRSLDNFARVNLMPSCAVPKDVV